MIREALFVHMTFINDIIKEKHKGYYKYSQGRFYLFVSFCAFFLLNVFLVWAAFAGHKVSEDQSIFIVAGNLKWALSSFALYVLGGKGIGAFRDRQTGIGNDYMHEARGNPYGYGYGYGHHHQSFYKEKETHNEVSEEIEDGYYVKGDEEVD